MQLVALPWEDELCLRYAENTINLATWNFYSCSLCVLESVCGVCSRSVCVCLCVSAVCVSTHRRPCVLLSCEQSGTNASSLFGVFLHLC